ncbi:DUF4245 domain-containing protein [Brachybacterium sp. J153]|uniref:DUF4245 domain-containing protein n=1 Tax=Brachybacterium sp. J153 TaxID=3116488 RepID=UPI002E76AD24|nr:DUF4245 domain-containing protein [Brachybacterium sp. J153]MEE1618278.1 DUF4245 domain-containing protein [Brachybacterium sp. J153]
MQEPPEAPQKSHYELPSRKNTVLRNMVWALLLTMGVVVIIGIAFFGVGDSGDRQVLENSELDVAASAERAQDAADFPVAAPEMGEEWAERDARFTGGEVPSWRVQYTAPSGHLVTLTEEAELSPTLVSAAVPGAVVEAELEIAGASCQQLTGEQDGSDVRALACEGEGFGLVVHGDVEDAELRALMDAALADVA